MGCLPKDCGSLTVSRPLFQAGDARKLKSWPEKGDLLEFESGNGTFSKLGGTWETCTNPLETRKCVCVCLSGHTTHLTGSYNGWKRSKMVRSKK